MKTIIVLLAVLILNIKQCYSQNSEFQVYSNGLIYSEKTMAKLSAIADSLNLKFKTCDFDKNFHGFDQTLAYYIYLDSINFKEVVADIDNNISINDFINKYPKSEIDTSALILRSLEKNYEEKAVVQFYHYNSKSSPEFSIDKELNFLQIDMKGKWLYEHYKNDEWSNEFLKILYFPNNFESKVLPKEYSLMIGYADCLIDTTTKKFYDKLKDGWVDLPDNWTSLSMNKKTKLLEEMRKTRVIGYCSMDTRPRNHAINIALLSAETYNWEVFLKAHLDIMNDRFERMSDGSYAWAGRKTYLKEIEELNINATDLLLGTCFRISDPAKNHYFGSISRIGRALSESSNPIEIENQILSIIQNKELDLFNRILFYYLFLNYNHNLSDEKTKENNKAKLAIAAIGLPPNYLK